ncbi:lysophospholipase L1-like esterase [Flavobacterium sp. 7E]|uniref:hypothetical protein n=1 Tax=Flavobacterium sp. 7E TaxID=2735898 RepID=UPI00156DC40D|nr:lysophospholipase L1-like esterase [Flavobacterium sp. 7E]
MNTTKSYFFQSFLIILLATLFFIGIKEVLPKQLFSEKEAGTKNVLIDSMLIDAINADKNIEQQGVMGDSITPGATDSLGNPILNQQVASSSNLGVVFSGESYENYNGTQFLSAFYEKLFQIETNHKGKVRIAYFGDSMTDGDFIVQDFRSEYQNKFGGEGVGFVAITSESASSRSSVTHQYSKNWKMQSYLNVKNPIRPFAVNGHVFFANDTINKTWVKYQAGRGKNTSQLNNPTLFYGSAANQNGFISYQIKNDTIIKKLNPTKILNTIQLAPNNLQAVTIAFKKAKSIPIYGVNFDNGKGVHVDNFSQRGNSGIPISKFDVPLMNAFQQKLGYDLIVLHYGTNVLKYGTLDFSWYDKSMTRTVERLQKSFPGAAILIISTADKSSKYDAVMKTDSAVVPLTNSQKRYAAKTKSAYIDLYKLMGGDGSMAKWVEQDPPLANKDYTHFNFRGAKKIGGMLFQELDKGYEKHKLLRKRANPINQNTTAVKIKSDSITNNQESTNGQ